MTRFTKPTRTVKIGVVLVLVGLLGAVGWAWSGANRGVAPDDWEIEDIVSRLHERGLEIQAVPTLREGSINDGAFLTAAPAPWSRLNCLCANPARIADWKGTVLCSRIDVYYGGRIQIGLWDDTCLVVGRFVFFGDPQLRAQIYEALHDPGFRANPKSSAS